MLKFCQVTTACASEGSSSDKFSTLPSPCTPLIAVELLDHCSLLQRQHMSPCSHHWQVGILSSFVPCSWKKRTANIRWYLGIGWKSNWMVQPLHSSWREHFTVSAHLVLVILELEHILELAAWSQLHPGSHPGAQGTLRVAGAQSPWPDSVMGTLGLPQPASGPGICTLAFHLQPCWEKKGCLFSSCMSCLPPAPLKGVEGCCRPP